ncbi:nickel ABC transporter permease [Paenibacillus odorifer]|uniref:nickel ABC transporter permease n=1 Tax=Paenibacillus odorifer TaxID=189426 RepID=UPI00289CDA3D|nr:nickel ABC transporter permease [Paenibacillus odorifer]
MMKYIAGRLLSLVPLLLLVILIASFLVRLSPVDAAEAYFSTNHIQPTAELLAEKRHELGIDQPFFVQYAQDVLRIARFDFGSSYLTGKPVLQEVAQRLPATLELAITSLGVTFISVLVLGYFSATRKNGWMDYLNRLLSYIGASIPQFWLGYLLVFFFSLKLDWLPIEGKGDWRNLVLPTLTLSFGLIAVYSRLLRENILQQLQETYVLYAKTRGIKEKSIMIKHVMRLAITPVITGLGMNIGKLLTGTIIVEKVFSWPGLGRYFIESIFNRDIPVVQGYVFLAACLYLIINLFVDLIQMYLDPRITLKGRMEF